MENRFYKFIIKSIIYFFVVPLISFAQDSYMGLNNNIFLNKCSQIKLEENLELIGRVECITPIDKDFFIVSSNNGSCVIYNKSGIQTLSLSYIGKGPFEFMKPYIVKAYNDTIVVWDAGSMKFIFYTKDGDPIKEITGFSEGISDFVCFNKKIVLYISGALRSHYIGIYDITKASFSRMFGLRNTEHDLLMFYAGSGGFDIKDHTLYYASPAEAVINIVNLETFNEKHFNVNDADFHVQKLEKNAFKEINPNKIMKYIFNNSRVVGIYILNRFIIAEIENGGIEDKTRETKIHVFDLDYNPIDIIKLNYSAREKLGFNIQFAYGDFVYFLYESSPDEGITIERTLYEYKISNIQKLEDNLY